MSVIKLVNPCILIIELNNSKGYLYFKGVCFRGVSLETETEKRILVQVIFFRGLFEGEREGRKRVRMLGNHVGSDGD